jgi:hypothetical protein
MPYSGFKPLVGGGPQRSSAKGSTTKTGLSTQADEADPKQARDAALRSTFVDKEEAAMLRAMARLNGDDAKSRDRGNAYSMVNRAKAAATAEKMAAVGLTPLDPLEQHELQRKMAAGYTTISDRAVPVPKVGQKPRPLYAPIDFVHKRKGEDEIREENNNFAIPKAPPYRPGASRDEKKDELALRNQFNGRTPQEMLKESNKSAAPPPPKPKPSGLRQQMEEEVAERHEFLDQMRALGRPVDHATEGRINVEIAERLQDLKKLEELGGEDL